MKTLLLSLVISITGVAYGHANIIQSIPVVKKQFLEPHNSEWTEEKLDENPGLELSLGLFTKPQVKPCHTSENLYGQLKWVPKLNK